MANKKYELIFRASADSWERVTPSVVETMFERAENENIRLSTFKDWLLKQDLSDAAKNRVSQYYDLILEDKKQEQVETKVNNSAAKNLEPIRDNIIYDLYKSANYNEKDMAYIFNLSPAVIRQITDKKRAEALAE